MKKDLDVSSMIFNERVVRVIARDGQPWWVAKDVCEVLGLGNTSEASSGLDADERAGVSIADTSSSGVIQSREVIIINESGLYSLIFKSRKPEAKVFKRWVTGEVLPALRRDGYFEIQPAKSKSKLELLQETVNAMVLAEARMNEQDSKIEALAQRVDLFGADTGFRTVRAYCKERGMRVSESEAREIGLNAARACKQAGLRVGRVADERHGSVNSYPLEVLAAVCE